jgi:hypothetical protein
MGAEYLSFAPTFYGYSISVLASVEIDAFHKISGNLMIKKPVGMVLPLLKIATMQVLSEI